MLNSSSTYNVLEASNGTLRYIDVVIRVLDIAAILRYLPREEH